MVTDVSVEMVLACHPCPYEKSHTEKHMEKSQNPYMFFQKRPKNGILEYRKWHPGRIKMASDFSKSVCFSVCDFS
jgi:hypothetical protein